MSLMTLFYDFKVYFFINVSVVAFSILIACLLPSPANAMPLDGKEKVQG